MPTKKKTPEFTDDEGRVWTLKLTLGNVGRVKASERIDLPDIEKFSELFAMLADGEQFGKVLWILCEDQGSQAGVTKEQFFDAMGGDALEAAWGALVESIENFTQPRLRPALRKIMDEAGECQLKGINLMVESMDSEAVREAMDDKIKTAVSQATAEIIGT